VSPSSLGRRAVRIVSTALITAGLVVLADVGLTLVWKEPLSTIYGSIQQGKAEDELDRLEERFLATAEVPGLVDAAPAASGRELRRRAGRLADLFAQDVAIGEGIGRIEIPRIDLDAVIINGTDTASLRKGPGRYPDTAFPGQGRTIGIAGHRTTYLAPFREIDAIQDGDEIVVQMPYATFTYIVEKHAIVEPSQVEIVDDVGYERVVLTACHPLYSAAQRWAVFAKLDEVELADSAES
jgi:sortase A